MTQTETHAACEDVEEHLAGSDLLDCMEPEGNWLPDKEDCHQVPRQVNFNLSCSGKGQVSSEGLLSSSPEVDSYQG